MPNINKILNRVQRKSIHNSYSFSTHIVFLIAMLTFTAYMMTYMFELGVFTYYEIPSIFIEVNISNLCRTFLFIGTVLSIIFLLLFISTKLKKKIKDFIYLSIIVIGVLYCAYDCYIDKSIESMEWILSPISLTSIFIGCLFGVLIAHISFVFDKTKFKKVDCLVEEYRKNLTVEKSSKYLSILFLFIVLSIGYPIILGEYIGYALSHSETEINGVNYAIIRIRSDGSALGLKLSNDGYYEKEYKIIDLSSTDTPLKTKNGEIKIKKS